MIEPWQVWSAYAGEKLPVLVVSSPHHLELTGGRLVTVAPITRIDRGFRHHVVIHDEEGLPAYVMTDQLRTVNSVRFTSQKPLFELHLDDIPPVRRALKHMVDF